MKIEPMTVGDLNVEVTIEDHPHAEVHAFRVTATCGQSKKSGVLTLNVPEKSTLDEARGGVQDFARRIAEECAAHERARAVKAKLLEE